MEMNRTTIFPVSQIWRTEAVVKRVLLALTVFPNLPYPTNHYVLMILFLGIFRISPIFFILIATPSFSPTKILSQSLIGLSTSSNSDPIHSPHYHQKNHSKADPVISLNNLKWLWRIF